MNIAIFGGSFDPIHIGHIEIVESAIERLDIDKLIVVPTFLNPFKESFLAQPRVRLGWIEEVLGGREKVEVSDFEIKQNRPTPSITTVEHFKKKLNPKKIYLIIGADNLSSLHKWRDFEKLKQIVEFVVATREGFKIPKEYKKLVVDVDISSSDLRANIDEKFLPNRISHKIKKHITDRERT